MPSGHKVLRLVAVCSLTLGALVALRLWFPCRVQWHAEIQLASLNCSAASICRLEASREWTAADARGGKFEVRSNAMGFRGPDLQIEPEDPRTLRIAFFGDSMVYGIGVDEPDTLPAATGRALQKALGDRPVQAMNFGLPMNYLISNLRAYQAFARAYRPDVVVFANPGGSPRDVNYRIIEIKSSPVLSAMMKWSPGRWLVNEYQTGTMDLYDREAAAVALRELAAPLLEDQQSRGMIVCFLHFFDSEDLRPFMPAGLAYVEIAPAFADPSAWRESDLAIPGDGHPTPAGHRFFAERVVAAILPQIVGGVR